MPRRERERGLNWRVIVVLHEIHVGMISFSPSSSEIGEGRGVERGGREINRDTDRDTETKVRKREKKTKRD